MQGLPKRQSAWHNVRVRPVLCPTRQGVARLTYGVCLLEQWIRALRLWDKAQLEYALADIEANKPIYGQDWFNMVGAIMAALKGK